MNPPALYRTSDIGVSAEWRAISYDWLPILTPIGVSIYGYLRDTYEQQRAMFPFLLQPEGPTKYQMQRKQGKRSAWAIQGPEYLLRVAGLAHVELGYGQSSDPAHPQRTRVAYYSIGRLDQPVLDWTMLSHVLDALALGLDSSSDHPDHQKAQSAIQALKQAGFLQEGDPGDLFWELGAWPRLLPTVIADARWEAIYSSLHTPAAIRRYREQARRWAEYAQQKVARLAHENQAMADMLQAAQRRGPQGSNPNRPTTDTFGSSALYQVPATQAVQVTSRACVAEESLESRQAVEVISRASATLDERSHPGAINPRSLASDSESLPSDQLMLTDVKREIDYQRQGQIPGSDITPFIQEDELHTTKLDAGFWIAVNQILYGISERYQCTAGEKKAAERQFLHRKIPTGVALAALRLVMTLPQQFRPANFGEALKQDSFQQAVHQALQLLPVQPQEPTENSWESFLWTYRTVHLNNGLRDVSQADYLVLRGLYDRHADECWEVLSRLQHAQSPVRLTPQYLGRAITNNRRAAAEHDLSPGKPLDRRSDIPDPRIDLLKEEGVNPTILSDEMTVEFIRAWIAEANARASSIKRRSAWLASVLRAGLWPTEPARPVRDSVMTRQPRAAEPAHPTPDLADGDSELHQWWNRVLTQVQPRITEYDYNTWIKPTRLLDVSEEQVVVAVPHIFAREALTGNEHLLQVLKDAVADVVPDCTTAEIVVAIDQSLANQLTQRGAQSC